MAVGTRRRRRGPRARRTRGSGSVYPRKDGRWAGQFSHGYDDKGEPVRSWVYGKTEREAEDRLNRLRNAAGTQQPGNGPVVRMDKGSVGEYLAKWLEDTKAMHPGSWHARKDKVNLIANTPVWTMRLQRLEKQHVIKLVNVDLLKVDPELSWQTRSHVKAVLRKALNDAIETNRFHRANPASKVEVLGLTLFVPKIMQPDEVQRFMAAALRSPLAALFIVGVLVGLRQGELLGLRWVDINFKTGMVSIRRQLRPRLGVSAGRKKGAPRPRRGENLELVDPKTTYSLRTFELPTVCRTMLRDLRDAQLKAHPGLGWNRQGLCFPTEEGVPMSASVLIRYFYHPVLTWAHLPISRRGQEGFRFHDLRHTATTLMLIGQIPEKIVMQRLGWGTRAMLDRYQHWLPQMDQQAVAFLNKFVAGLGTSTPPAP